MKFKVGGLTPEEDAARFRAARARRRARLRALRRRQPGLDAGRGDPLRAARRGPRPALVRGAVHLVERPARDAGRPLRRRRPRLRRAERVLRRRLPRPDGRGRDRLLQLRLVVVGRPDRVAARRRGRASPSTSRWPTTRSRRSPRTCSPRSRTGRSSRCSTPTATRSGGTSSPTGRRSSTGRIDAADRARARLGARRATTSRRTGSRRVVTSRARRAGARAGTRREGGTRHRRRRRDRAAVAARVRRGRGASRGARPRRRTLRDAVAASLPGDGHVGIGADLARRRRARAARRATPRTAVGPLDGARPSRGSSPPPARHRARSTRRTGTRRSDVNLKATFFLNRAFAELLRGAGRGGRDRQLQLQGWWTGGFGGSVVYDATKGGIVTMTRGLARTYGTAGIRSTRSPGPRRHADAARRPRPPTCSQRLVEQIPIGRHGGARRGRAGGRLPRLRAARYITGATLNISGGWLMY